MGVAAMTFTLNVIVINLFIGVLGVEYSRACEHSTALFWQERSKILLDLAAQGKGYAAMARCVCCGIPKCRGMMTGLDRVLSTSRGHQGIVKADSSGERFAFVDED